MQGGRRVLPAEGSRPGTGGASKPPAGPADDSGAPSLGLQGGGAPPGGAGDAFFREKLCDEE